MRGTTHDRLPTWTNQGSSASMLSPPIRSTATPRIAPSTPSRRNAPNRRARQGAHRRRRSGAAERASAIGDVGRPERRSRSRGRRHRSTAGLSALRRASLPPALSKRGGAVAVSVRALLASPSPSTPSWLTVVELHHTGERYPAETPPPPLSKRSQVKVLEVDEEEHCELHRRDSVHANEAGRRGEVHRRQAP